MDVIERKLMGHGGVYDELGQVATMLGTGHADPRRCGERIDAVRDAVEEIDRQHRGAVDRADAAYDALVDQLGSHKLAEIAMQRKLEAKCATPGGQ